MRPYRVLCLMAIVVLMGVVLLPQTAFADTIFEVGNPTYTNNGVEKSMNVAPYVHDGRTFLPITFVADALGISGSDVIWDEIAQTVTLVKGDKIVQMKIGSTTMLVNGAAITLDAPPEVQGGRTCLPVALVVKSFDYSINWDPAAQSITISGSANSGNSSNNSGTAEEKSNNSPVINNNNSSNSIDLTSLNYYGTDAGSSLHIDQLSSNSPLEMAGNQYDKGFTINNNYSKAASKYVAYKLDSAYTRLTGILGIRVKGLTGKYTDKMIIYGDDRVLYESPYFIKTDAPLDVDIDITGVDVLKFYFCGNGDAQWGYPVFANPKLSNGGNNDALSKPTNTGPIDLTSLNYYGTDAGSNLHIDQLSSNSPLEMAGNQYDKGFTINNNYSKAASKYVAYKLDSAYTRLTGILGIRVKGLTGKYTDKMIIYGDDRVLYESPYFTKTDAPLDVDIDITGVDVLKFYFCGNGDAQWGYPVFANPKLY